MAIRDLATSQISEVVVEEIRQLHAGIIAKVRSHVLDGIRIGEILTQVKGALRHGEWLPWLEANAPFSQPTAWYYMSSYDRRDEIRDKLLAGNNFTYKLLLDKGNGSEPPNPQRLHQSTFWTDNAKLGQKWFGMINHEIKDHPLETWRKDQWISLAASLEPFVQLYSKLTNLIE